MVTAASSAEYDPRRWAAPCARALAQGATLPGLANANSRGTADAIACRARFGLSGPGRSLRPGGVAGTLFDALADARAEALGALWLPGIARNLDLRREAPTHAKALWRGWAYAVFRQRPAPCPADFHGEVQALGRMLDAPDAYAAAAAALALRWADRWRVDALTGWSLAIDADTDPDAATGGRDDDDAAMSGRDASEAVTAAQDESSRGSLPPLPVSVAQNYRIFTRRHDRVVTPDDLASPDELVALRARLDAELAPYRQVVIRMAHQLQRVLLSRKRQHWDADQEAGQLDPSRLARLVADSSQTRVFRIDSEGRFKHTAVTLLLDNSGSMRGRPILIAALTADILARTLERCAIPVEVLGFTTTDWAGGAPARDWEQAGRPPHPGRLNALRHIVYKPMATPWRRARLGLGVMLKDGLLKENIDGEALAWASQRLLQRTESRRILVVVSDGAPMDRSTLNSNPAAMLDQHLHDVVAWIEQRTDLELCAFGIGHDVRRHYRRAVKLDHVEHLGPALIGALTQWLI